MAKNAWFKDLFIKEAKAALSIHQDSGEKTHYTTQSIIDEASRVIRGNITAVSFNNLALNNYVCNKTKIAMIPGERYFVHVGDQKFEITEFPETANSWVTIATLGDSYEIIYRLYNVDPSTNRADSKRYYLYIGDRGTVPDEIVGETLRIVRVEESVVPLDEKYIPDTIQRVGGDVIIPSSTADSTKKFKLTVDDSGTITATEVTDS